MDYAVAYLEQPDEEAFYLQVTWTASEEQSIPHTDDITIETASVADNAVTVLLTANRPGEWTYGLPFTLEREIGGTWYHVPRYSAAMNFHWWRISSPRVYPRRWTMVLRGSTEPSRRGTTGCSPTSAVRMRREPIPIISWPPSLISLSAAQPVYQKINIEIQ